MKKQAFTATERAEFAAARAARVADLHNQLAAEVEAIQDSAGFKRWLRAISRFHRYSARNCMLIVMQRPDATQVAGFGTWLANGRTVRKGEKGIAILAPVTFVRTRASGAGDDEEDEIGLRFKIEYVFDVSQTEPIPGKESPYSPVTGDTGADLYAALEDLAAEYGWAVFAGLPAERAGDPHLDGCCYSHTRQIFIRPAAQARMAYVLIHELAHVLTPAIQERDHAEREVIAEGVAYIAANQFGIDTSGESFPYIAAIAYEDASRLVMELCTEIQKVAHTILDALDQRLGAQALDQR
jgi:N-terminal domain of anti-restriction factor ArdC